MTHVYATPMPEHKMTKAHENAEVIKAWADGKVIQWFDSHSAKWTDFNRIFHYGPWLSLFDAWRIKPEPKKGWVRVAEHKSGPITWGYCHGHEESEIEGFHDFIRWLSPRFEFDYYESV